MHKSSFIILQFWCLKHLAMEVKAQEVKFDTVHVTFAMTFDNTTKVIILFTYNNYYFEGSRCFRSASQVRLVKNFIIIVIDL